MAKSKYWEVGVLTISVLVLTISVLGCGIRTALCFVLLCALYCFVLCTALSAWLDRGVNLSLNAFEHCDTNK